MSNIFSLAFLVALVAIMAGLGSQAVARLDRNTRLNSFERACLSLGLGAIMFYLSIFAVGMVRLDAISMWLLMAVLAVAALPGMRRIPWHELIATVHRLAFNSGLTARILAIATMAVGLSSLLQGLAAPNDYDSLMYHIALPRYDVEAGYLAVPWDRALTPIFFPALGGHLSRLALALANDGVAQMTHGSMGLVAAAATALAVRRLGFGRDIALGSALSFLSIRVVVWEMGTVEVDVLLASFTMLAFLAYLAWREHSENGLAVLFGLMIGGALATKYHGILVALSFGPLIAYDLLVRRRSWLGAAILAPGAAFVVMLPHFVRNVSFTGNPVFPILNTIFNPGDPDLFAGLSDAFGTGRSIVDLAIGPWTIFVSPMHYYDGMIFGAPYILALAPLILLDHKRAQRWLPPLSVAAGYYVLWFYLVGQQVRFLLPAMPFIAAVAVGGTAEAWSRVRHSRLLRGVFATVVTLFVATQAMFVGVYAALRLPPAVGLVDRYTYLLQTPTMEGSFIDACTFVHAQLKPGDTYFSLIQPHSYYCPQVSALHGYFPDEAKWWLRSLEPPPMTAEEFSRRLEVAKFRFIVVPVRWENRRNEIARSDTGDFDLSQHRLGRHLASIARDVRPMFDGRYAAVYDANEVLNALKSQLAAPSAP
jgi:hypothetical protein